MTRFPFRTALVTMALVWAGVAAAEPRLEVVERGGVQDGVLGMGGAACCGSGGCDSEFVLRNVGDATARSIDIDSSDLIGASGSIPSGNLTFEPSHIAKLGPGGEIPIRVQVAIPTALRGGFVAGDIRLQGAEGTSVELPVKVELCRAPTGSLQFLPDVGDFVGDQLQLRPVVACSGTRFVGRFAVVAGGDAVLEAVAPELLAGPAGVAAVFSPSAIDLAPGATGWFELDLVVAGSLAATEHVAQLEIADRHRWAVDQATLKFERCPQPTPGLAIVGPAEGNLEPLADQCVASDVASGVPFDVEFTVVVENTGDAELADVGLFGSGLATGLEIETTPSFQPIAVAGTANFRVRLVGVASQSGSQFGFDLRAVDLGTRVEDRRTVAIRRCSDSDRPEPSGPVLLALEYRSSRTSARIGEILTLTVVVRNAGTGPARELWLEQQLPGGFSYIKGRSALDGRIHDDPIRSARLRWRLPDLAAGAETRLGLQAVVGSGVAIGTATGRAWAVSDGVEFGPAVVPIEVTRDSLRPFGGVVGRVGYAHGGAVPGVRVLLDGDREAMTGKAGEFAFDGVLGGQHLVSLDVRTLDRGERPIGEDNQFLHLFSGATAEVEFVIAAPPTLQLRIERIPAQLR